MKDEGNPPETQSPAPAVSGAGWSEGCSPAQSGSGRSSDALEEGERYRKRDIVGAGGMGTVHRAHDNRLLRDVALKELRPERDESIIIREAQLAAQLEHPNIISIYDAGTGEGGEAFYTMRLIHGRPMSELLLEADDLKQRLSLLRHYLDLCEGIAFAHNRGIVHRDLKPANVMVGEFGETQIVDWGLATFVEEAAAEQFEAEVGIKAVGRGRPVGTPGYMSPEQEQGEKPQYAADVWSLGVILFEILTKKPSSGSSAQSNTPESESDFRLALSEVEGQLELKAICKKALATRPSERYPTAKELAADVERHLEGNRIEAHVYSSYELLGRLLSTWKIPLAIGMLALMSIAVVLVVSWIRISGERNRAVQAEEETQFALRESTQTLGWALAGQALSAHFRSAGPEAEVLAAHALLREESPEARGVLSATHAKGRPTQSLSWVAPDCRRSEPSIEGALLCIGDDEISFWDPPQSRMAKGRKRWSVTREVISAHQVADEVAVLQRGTLAFLSADTGTKVHEIATEHTLLVVDRKAQRVLSANNGEMNVYELPSHRLLHTLRPCGNAIIQVAGANGGYLAASCRGTGELVIMDHRSGARIASTVLDGITMRRPASSVTISADGKTAVLGDVHGALTIVRFQDEVHTTRQEVSPGTPIRRLSFLSSRLIAVVPEQGGTRLWDLHLGVERLRLPAGIHELVADGMRIACAGTMVTAWQIPASISRALFLASAGLSSATSSPDDKTIVATGGDGRLHRWSVNGAQGRSSIDLSDNVLKRVAFDASGERLIVSTSDRSGLDLVSATQWEVITSEASKRATRRVAMLKGDTAIVAHYGEGLLTYVLGEARANEIAGPVFIDAVGTREREIVSLLSEGGEVFQIGEDLRLEKRFGAPGAVALAYQPSSQTFALAHDAAVQLYSREGKRLRTMPSTVSGLADIAISPDGEWCVASSRGGTIEVWELSTGKLWAVLRGHTQRVPFIEFRRDGTLLSASWDGSVRLWNLQVLRRSPSELAEASIRTWGFGLDKVSLSDSPLPILNLEGTR